MLDVKAIGEYITFLREKHNLTQYELADKLYVTHQAVSKWETGKSLPNIEVMLALTKLFNITIDELLLCKEAENQDFKYLLENYPRNYVVYQLVKQNLKVKIEEVLYLLSDEERGIVLNHIINNNLTCDIDNLLPYLNKNERILILNSIIDKKIKIDINTIYHQLSQSEKKYLEGNNEYQKNFTFFR